MESPGNVSLFKVRNRKMQMQKTLKLNSKFAFYRPPGS